jgi:redox-sensitive bicupin YhaK (pirin superfamily)
MPRQSNGLMRGFQLWINLPASEKMSDPAYQEFSPEAIPEIRLEGATLRILAGEHTGVRGVIDDPHTDVRYFDLRLAPGARVQLPLPTTHAGFAYVYEGNARIASQALARHSLGMLGAGETVEIAAGDDGACLILVAGRPLGEPIVQYGPFVMNTREEIEQAFVDYRDGTLARHKATRVSNGAGGC